jgi:hypothetical protein
VTYAIADKQYVLGYFVGHSSVGINPGEYISRHDPVTNKNIGFSARADGKAVEILLRHAAPQNGQLQTPSCIPCRMRGSVRSAETGSFESGADRNG